MSESSQHKKLVALLIKSIIEIIGEEKKLLLLTDSNDGFDIPPLTAEGFRPDVYYNYENLLIIGEAKTSADIERLHSRKQYESYIKKCSLFHADAIFLVAVPWMDHAAIHNILSRIQKKYPGQYQVKILDGMGEYI